MRSVARWLAAFLCILYGFAKMVGVQFLVLDSELVRPLSAVPGFWLTWYYFGVSPQYKVFITGAEVLAGVLLAFPRTATLGGLMLFGLALNIVMIDLSFGVDPGGTGMAILLLTLSIVILAPELGRIRGALIRPAGDGRDRWRAVAVTGLVAISSGLGYWMRHVVVEDPTPIDGTWAVERAGGSPTRWEKVFFERERAEMVVFRDTAGSDAVDRFAIDSAGGIAIWGDYYASEHPKPHGPLIWEGRVAEDGRITLRGVDSLHADSLILRQVGLPGAPAKRSGPLGWFQILF